jgi:hypothetical protein
VRVEDKTPKGYRREDFVDAWERFLHSSRSGATKATKETSQSHSQADVAFVASVAHTRERGEAAEWLARDGIWRSFETDPPALPGEIAETR